MMNINRRLAVFAFIAWLFTATATSYAEIDEFKQINIDLTDKADAEAKATWSEPDKITISPAGLGWDGEGDASRDGWIQTKPIALGLSWRPTQGIYTRVSIHPLPQEVALANGQKWIPDSGALYVRYSPDLKHWSSWQVLQRSEPQSTAEKKNPGRHFSGEIRVPYRDQDEYRRLVSDYSRMDVPWKSDEEAAVKWIVARDPEFFAKQIPFIGYAQLMFEGAFRGGLRIQSFKADIFYGMSGLHVPPKDESVYQTRDVPWRYEDAKRQTSIPETTQGKDARPSP